MKRVIPILLALALCLTGCAAEQNNTYYQKSQEEAREGMTRDDGHILVESGKEQNDMNLLIGETEVPITWEDNPSVEALKALLPLTIEMSMYGGFEQVGPIGQDIVRDDEPTETGPGDVVLYAGDQIVVFYGNNSWAYTHLGHIDLTQQEMENLLAHGDVTLTLTAAGEDM